MNRLSDLERIVLPFVEEIDSMILASKLERNDNIIVDLNYLKFPVYNQLKYIKDYYKQQREFEVMDSKDNILKIRHKEG